MPTVRLDRDGTRERERAEKENNRELKKNRDSKRKRAKEKIKKDQNTLILISLTEIYRISNLILAKKD